MRTTFALLCYNQEKFVGEAVAAALAQHGEPLDIVVSDDCSNDGTFAALQAALANYAGPHCVALRRNPVNLGVGAHTDLIVRQATGEIVILAAGDDVSLPQRAQRIAQAFADPALTCIASAVQAGGKIESPMPEVSTDAQTAVLHGHPLLGATLAFRRQALLGFAPLPTELRYGEDIVLPFRAALAGRVAMLDEPLVIYRRHAGSLMGIVGLDATPQIYIAGLRRTLTSLALLRRLQKESIDTALTQKLIAPAPAQKLHAHLQYLIEREEPMRALLFREPGALGSWLRAVRRRRLAPAEAIKALLTGTAPGLWHRYTLWRARRAR